MTGLGEITSVAVEKMIYVIRGQKVMLDTDLAVLYRVEVRALNQAVSRNQDRFPEDFAFRLSAAEHEALRSQNVILKKGRGQHRKFTPMAFTEQGVAMLSGVLKSKRAVAVNVSIMRTFVKLRRLLAEQDLSGRVANLEKGTDRLFKIVFHRLDVLEMNTPVLPRKRRKIGIGQG